ncbi:DUF378 domain-containing protein [Amphibacillus indicireducens]|uniref:DUF378 domain-containing protein n=1 Tax=Amphibacillus indicireducens TaxID=1076330 RepID=A0ABP7V8K3_9BACI
MQTLKRIALTLVIIGAINWGLIGLFQFDLVAAIFGGQTTGLSRLIYTLVGISGIICLSFLFDPLEETERDQPINPRSVNYGVELGEDFDYEREKTNYDERLR